MTEATNADLGDAIENPSRMLRSIRDKVDEQSLRKFACECCRRMFEKYPLDWAQLEFAKYRPGEIRYVGPDDWIDPRPRAAVEAAEAFCCGKLSGIELGRAHEQAREFADDMRRRWEWINRRLGDAGHIAEYDVGGVLVPLAAAARSASDPDIRQSVIDCAEQAANAIGFRASDAKRIEAICVEKSNQMHRIRQLDPAHFERSGHRKWA